MWGWTGFLVTDSQFMYDYQFQQISGTFDPFQTGVAAEAVSQLYLSGAGERSYFDIRSIYYYGFSEVDKQAQIPIIHPVLDYSNVLGQQVLGGEFSYKFNLTSLTRQQANLTPSPQTASHSGACSSPTADTAVRGELPVARHSGQLFALLGAGRLAAHRRHRQRPDDHAVLSSCVATSLRSTSTISRACRTTSPTGQSELARAMPAVGVEYRYPFVDVEPWGTQTIEPIAQLIVRPNETDIGKFPNEDAQSLVFDDSNLFQIDKFSGWDRVEGGSRANAGFQYTAQFNRAGSVNVSVRPILCSCSDRTRSRSATSPIPAWTAASTRPISDYVGRVTYQPNSDLFVHRARTFRRSDLYAGASRVRKPRQFRSLDAATVIRRLCGATAARLPDATRGHSRRRLR